LIFGKLFDSDPMLWLDVQDKNKFVELKKNQPNKRQYSLDELLDFK